MIRADVVGPVCETGDFLARDRDMPDLHAGDLLAICTAGAYGFVQASNYNSRRGPPRCWLRDRAGGSSAGARATRISSSPSYELRPRLRRVANDGKIPEYHGIRRSCRELAGESDQQFGSQAVR